MTNALKITFLQVLDTKFSACIVLDEDAAKIRATEESYDVNFTYHRLDLLLGKRPGICNQYGYLNLHSA